MGEIINKKKGRPIRVIVGRKNVNLNRYSVKKFIELIIFRRKKR
jgi:hypothetical protein